MSATTSVAARPAPAGGANPVAAGGRSDPPRYDAERLKRDHPIAAVVAAAGVELRPSGGGLVGRCPLHDDRGRPNLRVYPETASYYCFRCGLGGDVIDFVMRREGLTFPEACARLAGAVAGAAARRPADPAAPPAAAAAARRWDRLGLDEQEAMNHALTVYRRALWADPEALSFVRGRGLPDWLIRRAGVGLADGHSLAAYLRRHGRWDLLDAAVGLGLLRPCFPRSPGGRPPLRDHLTGRVVVPELRGGHAVWFVGRSLDDRPGRPKYLALEGERPVLGYERATGRPEVFLCEGVFDYLTAVAWGLAAFSPCGTALPADRLGFLARAHAVYGVLDADPAGRAAAGRFGAQLGARFVPLRLPDGTDLNDLGRRPDGRAVFAAAVGRARAERAPAGAGAPPPLGLPAPAREHARAAG